MARPGRGSQSTQEPRRPIHRTVTLARLRGVVDRSGTRRRQDEHRVESPSGDGAERCVPAACCRHAMDDGEPEGEIEFDTDPDEPGEVLLDFDPRGQLVEVRQGGVTYLSREFPN